MAPKFSPPRLITKGAVIGTTPAGYKIYVSSNANDWVGKVDFHGKQVIGGQSAFFIKVLNKWAGLGKDNVTSISLFSIANSGDVTELCIQVLFKSMQ
jgi:hypothetical protein